MTPDFAALMQQCHTPPETWDIAEYTRLVIEVCATAAAIHSQYPITTDYDKGYAKARADSAAAIRSLKP